jgi:pimeloyl-ACP methyl ester carboxylesterase
MEQRCATRYPIVLLHGLGYRDDMPLLSSWGRIPKRLERAGARVYLGGLDAWAPYEYNAALLKTQVERFLAQAGADKVNVIAHSRGGIEARYMISRLGMAAHVASLTTVCTPHRGTAAADAICGLVTSSAALAGMFARWAGDRSPDGAASIRELSRPAMQEFNKCVPDAPGVLYRSYGSLMKSPLDDPFFALSYVVVLEREGENDGMVAANSCRWGDFRGYVSSGPGHRGISHLDMVDFHKHAVGGIEIPERYVSAVEELKALGC